MCVSEYALLSPVGFRGMYHNGRMHCLSEDATANGGSEVAGE